MSSRDPVLTAACLASPKDGHEDLPPKNSILKIRRALAPLLQELSFYTGCLCPLWELWFAKMSSQAGWSRNRTLSLERMIDRWFFTVPSEIPLRRLSGLSL